MNVLPPRVHRLVLLSLLGVSTALSAQTQSVLSSTSSPVTFEAVTIKPSDPNQSSGTYFRVQGHHVIAANVSLFDLLSFAYELHPKQIVNGPKWLDTATYNIDGVPALGARPTRDQQRQLFQSLLTDRFHLACHYEQRELSVYALVLDKGGPKFSPTTRQPQDSTNFSYTNQIVLTVKNATMATVADGMQASFLNRPVVDRTGLTGHYDFTLKWTSDDSPTKDTPEAPPDLYTAIKEQLGLKLIPTKAIARALVVDRVDPPSSN